MNYKLGSVALDKNNGKGEYIKGDGLTTKAHLAYLVNDMSHWRSVLEQNDI